MKISLKNWAVAVVMAMTVSACSKNPLSFLTAKKDKSDPKAVEAQAPEVIVIKNAKIFNGTSAPVIDNGFLVIKGDKILKITVSLTEVTQFENAQVIDGTRKTIIPLFLSDDIALEAVVNDEGEALLEDPSLWKKSKGEEDTEVAADTDIHEQMAQLVYLGLTPQQALTAATSKMAKVLGKEGQGILVEDGRADFIVINGDPMESIYKTKAIYEIWENGKVIMRDDMQDGKTIDFQDL